MPSPSRSERSRPEPASPAVRLTANSPRLRRLAKAGRAGAQAEPDELCELCGAPLPAGHRHLLDLDTRQVQCACRACSLLMDRPAAGGGHWRLIPERRVRLAELDMEDRLWDQLQIPVEMAFFFHHSVAGRVMAFYPSPMGATESHLELAAWSELEAANPVLATLEPDVEALLVYRSRPPRGARRQWLVPIDDCYRLVAVIRTRWRGFTGGREVWQEIDRFFEDLDRLAVRERS